MTQVKHLPIYASAYIFVREIYRIKIKLPRAIKYDLGQECFGSALKILKCIVLANQAMQFLIQAVVLLRADRRLGIC